MRPSSSILINWLSAAGQQFLSIVAGYTKRFGGGFVSFAGLNTARLRRKEPKERLNELVVCWDGHTGFWRRRPLYAAY